MKTLMAIKEHLIGENHNFNHVEDYAMLILFTSHKGATLISR